MERRSYLKEVYRSLRSSFLVIGLTGRLGSGVSTTANVISEIFTNTEETQRFLSRIKCCDWLEQIDKYEPLRTRRLEKFWFGLNYEDSSDRYKPKILKVRLILLLLFKRILNLHGISILNDIASLLDERLIEDLRNTDFIEKLQSSVVPNDILNELFSINYRNLSQEEKLNQLEQLINSLKEIDYGIIRNYENSGKLYIYVRFLQELGRFLRSFEHCPNNIYDGNEVLSCFNIVELCRRLISIYRKSGKYNIFIIDALRNNLEIEFFRNRYGNFYLISLLVNEDTRKQRLKQRGLKEENIRDLLKIETKKPRSETELYEQNIDFCITKADIFVDNTINESGLSRLKYQLIKYLTLIIHPGLVPPTKDEVFMQVAISARYASGCISRQVGAVILGQDGYVRGIGWNDVPEGHVSCSLRDFELFEENKKYFSPYEIENLTALYEEYKTKIEWKDYLPFCFKDIKNYNELGKSIDELKKELKNKGYDSDETSKITEIIKKFVKAKNPSRERALHAEENAYLQAAKVGGVSVKGGTLYTTDFPCQLCSKKTVQLQISRIVYIEDYPDISKDHTLRTDPNLRIDFFKGAVREAYFKLYAPFMPIKDEIELYLRSTNTASEIDTTEPCE